MSRRHVFDDPDLSAELLELHHMFDVVPADKASDIVFVCKTHYINCLMEMFRYFNCSTSCQMVCSV